MEKKGFKKRQDSVLIWGRHSCYEAIRIGQRKIFEIVCVESWVKELNSSFAELLKTTKLKVVSPRGLNNLTGSEALHQGLAMLIEPVKTYSLENLLISLENEARVQIVCLDQITDPRNVGSILRSCAAFCVGGVISTFKHSPQDSGLISRASTGGVEIVKQAVVTNLASAIDELKDAGFTCIGLTCPQEGALPISSIEMPDKVAIFLGAEGKGLRRLTSQKMDIKANIPIAQIDSLNVGCAAAIAMYEFNRRIEN